MLVTPETNISGGAGAFSIGFGFCMSQSFQLISDLYVSWALVCFLRLTVTFVVLGPDFLPV
jgi:hypothetical protein